MVIAVLVALGLRFLFVATRTGVAMRAVVDDPDLLELNAGKPERLAMASWALGAFLAALAGVLITPIQGSTMSADGSDAAGHRRLRGGHVRAAAQRAAHVRRRARPRPRRQLRDRLLPGAEWTWAGNFRVSLPMIALFVVLLFLPQDRLRGATVLRTRERYRMPSMRNAVDRGRRRSSPACTWCASCWRPTAVNTLAFGMTAAVIALSLVLLTGYAGRDQPGRAVVRRHRGDRRPPLRGRTAAAQERPLDPLRLRAGRRGVRRRRGARGAAVVAPARAVPRAVDAGVRRVRVEHDPARDRRAEAAAASTPGSASSPAATWGCRGRSSGRSTWRACPRSSCS